MTDPTASEARRCSPSLHNTRANKRTQSRQVVRRVRRKKADFADRVRRKEASEYLYEVWGVEEAPGTLAKKAVYGEGPLFKKWGRFPYYDTDELDRYAAKKLGMARRTTSQAADQ